MVTFILRYARFLRSNRKPSNLKGDLMSKIKLNLSQLSIGEKIAKGRQLVTALTGSLRFKTPSPALADITTAVNELETAAQDVQAARQEAKTKTTIQGNKEDLVDRLLTQLAAYVESVAGDDQEAIQSAGMDTRSPRTSATGAPPMPAALTPTAGDKDGEVDLSWEPVRQARSYVIERSEDPPTATSWTHAGISTKSSITIKGLKSGTRYWFRVAAIGPGGQSAWSDPATKIAP